MNLLSRTVPRILGKPLFQTTPQFFFLAGHGFQGGITGVRKAAPQRVPNASGLPKLQVLLGLSLTCTMSASFAALAWSFQSGRPSGCLSLGAFCPCAKDTPDTPQSPSMPDLSATHLAAPEPEKLILSSSGLSKPQAPCRRGGSPKTLELIGRRPGSPKPPWG